MGQQWDVVDFRGVRRQARAAVTAIAVTDAESEPGYVTDDASEVTDPDRPITDVPIGPDGPLRPAG